MLKRTWGALLLLVAALVMAQLTGRKLMYTVAYVVAGLLVVSLLLTAFNLLGIQVQRRTHARRSQVGKTADETFTVINTLPLPKLWLEVEDHSTLPFHRASRVISSLGPHRRRIWTVRTYCVRRGRFTLGPLTLRSSDPFGFFALKRRLPDFSHIVVYPATVDIPRFRLPFGELAGGEVMRRRTHDVTDNVSGVRDYVYGDNFSRIHWRTTARTGRLMSKEFELDPSTDVWVYLDMDAGVHVAPPWAKVEERSGPALLWAERARLELLPTTEEYTVTVGASLVRHLLTQGRSVGLVAYGQTREVAQADRGDRQLSKVLETLAVLEAKGSLPFEQILAAEGESLPHGTTIIAVTPSAEIKWIRAARELRRRGVRIVAVLINARSFAPAPEQNAALHELSMSQIPTFVINRGDNIGAALSAPAAGPALDSRVRGVGQLGAA